MPCITSFYYPIKPQPIAYVWDRSVDHEWDLDSEWNDTACYSLVEMEDRIRFYRTVPHIQFFVEWVHSDACGFRQVTIKRVTTTVSLETYTVREYSQARYAHGADSYQLRDEEDMEERLYDTTGQDPDGPDDMELEHDVTRQSETSHWLVTNDRGHLIAVMEEQFR